MIADPPTLAYLLADTDDATVLRGADEPVSAIVYDSRDAEFGALFVALRGAYSDGHDYLEDARNHGAASCLIDRDLAGLPLDGYAAVARVPDSRRALAAVARRYYGDPSRSLKLVGITGTDGKTTTSYIVEHLLQVAGAKTGLIGTIAIRQDGRQIRSAGRQTTPESLETQRLLADMRDAGVEVAIVETSSHGLETHRVDGCLFDVGVITNITHEHIDFHGSVEAYRRAKARLFDMVAASRDEGGLGVAIVNVDDPGARSVRPSHDDLEVIEYGMDCPGRCRVAASQVRPNEQGYQFDLHLDRDVHQAELPMTGRWNVSNALAAVAVCRALDVDVELILEGMRTLPAVPGRMQTVQAGQPFGVIVDYAHTAPALEHVLKSVRETTTGSVLLLFGSAGERDIEKRAEMGAIAARCADYFVVTSEDPRFEDPDAIIEQIADGAKRAGAIEGVDFDRQTDRRTAIEQILSRAGEADTVILAGKGHEQSMIFGAEQRQWDESGVAIDVLRTLGYMEPE
ncbi:UDP-N-acetylmuramoyl-L-alanyl-D-glutamate--2,6-diaminopimelate ligase [soil metagenome]